MASELLVLSGVTVLCVVIPSDEGERHTSLQKHISNIKARTAVETNVQYDGIIVTSAHRFAGAFNIECEGGNLTPTLANDSSCFDHALVFGRAASSPSASPFMLITTIGLVHTYHRTRIHRRRAVEPFGRIVPVPILGGLHHQYVRI
jgi:hypothetical protein